MGLIYSRQLLVTFIPAIFILLIAAIISMLFNIDMSLITRDVTAIGKMHPLSGVLSSLGIILWCVAASICFFSAMVIGNIKQINSFWFLLNSAFLSTYLMIDDLFLLHENLFPIYLGVNEKMVLVILGSVVFYYIATYRYLILNTKYSVLLLAMIFLSISVFVDIIVGSWLYSIGHWIFFIEDGFKWLGIVSWCSYYVHTSLQIIRVQQEA
ncbi:MAG: hypothetical protein L3K24_14560 [Gammaproteobacteria bacterium]|nr:hypothetical protein [Gammaproteobacteria bacterium]